MQVTNTLYCSDVNNEPEHMQSEMQNDIDQHYTQIVDALKSASNSSVPIHKKATKFWWDQKMNILKDAAIKTHFEWVSAGKPRAGPIFLARNQANCSYRLEIKKKQGSEKLLLTESLGSALCNKSSNQFWKIWKNKFSPKRQSPVVDGLIDDIEIANHFANKFKDICTPNYPAKNIQFENEYKFMFSSYIGDQKQISFNVEAVDIVVQSLKKDKAADIEGISAEHIIAAHPILIVILKFLFELIIRTGLVPGGFGRGITHPIPKSKVNSKTLTADDFRAITICPIISKVFEHCLLSRISNYLDTSPRQFGFKKGTGCNHAIYMLRKTVDFFTSNGSTVNVAMLDLSKAFDKINHFRLFITLMKRNVPIAVINILSNWYSRISTRVSFSGILSTTVVLVSGVRQGGVLFPFFFRYM